MEEKSNYETPLKDKAETSEDAILDLLVKLLYLIEVLKNQISAQNRRIESLERAASSQTNTERRIL